MYKTYFKGSFRKFQWGRDFWWNLHEITSCLGNVQNHGHTIDKSTFSRGMNKQLLNVSALLKKSCIKFLFLILLVARNSFQHLALMGRYSHALFTIWCYNHCIKKPPKRWWTWCHNFCNIYLLIYFCNIILVTTATV